MEFVCLFVLLANERIFVSCYAGGTVVLLSGEPALEDKLNWIQFLYATRDHACEI
jgi:hypothetical protein